MNTAEIIRSFIIEYYLYGGAAVSIICMALAFYYDDSIRRRVIRMDSMLVPVIAFAAITFIGWFIIFPALVILGVIRGLANLVEHIKSPGIDSSG